MKKESDVTALPPALDAPFPALVERIVREASVADSRILKIDHFLNHRIEPAFMSALGDAMAARIGRLEPDIILTAEASGIAPALATATALGIPMLYAKKYAPVVVEPPALSRIVPSPTKAAKSAWSSRRAT
jgi:xanthine phosphoribosyltransferase